MTTGGRDSDPLASTVAHSGDAAANPEDLAAGHPLGRYAIVRTLGSGAMGVVYEAHDPQLDRRVAIKVVHPRRALDPTGAERLLREARALARLRHPNVVAVHDAGRDGERLFVAMEMIDGKSLGELMRAGDRRDWLDLFRDAGRGLAAAHAAGILHRDFKPDNVLVAADGRVCVGDFGLAELSGRADPLSEPPARKEAGDVRLTTTGALLGTPAYMAPEQHAGKHIDARADQFAFCVALWEATYGERPFDGSSLAALGGDVMAGRIRPAPRRHWLEPLLRRGLAVDPDARFASMDELLRAIDRRRARPRRVAVLAGVTVGVGAALGLGAILARGGGGGATTAASTIDAGAPHALGETLVSRDAPLTPVVGVSPEGDAVLFVGYDRVTLIHVPDGKRAALASPEGTQVVGGYVESASRAILSAVAGDQPASLVAWDPSGSALTPIHALPETMFCIGTTAAGEPVCMGALGGGGDVQILDRGAWRTVVTGADGELPRVSPDHTRVALTANAPPRVVVADLRTGVVETYDAPGGALGVAWADGDRVLYGDLDGGEIRELDLTTRVVRVRRDRKGASMIRPLALRAGSVLALSTSLTSKTRRMDLASGTTGQSELSGPLEPLGYTQEGTLIALDLETMKLERVGDDDHTASFGVLPGAPVDASVAGDLILTVDRDGATCAIVARALPDAAERWRQPVACTTQLACAAEMSAPCVALSAAGVRPIDLATGVLGAATASLDARQASSASLGPRGDVVASVQGNKLHLDRLDGGRARLLDITSEYLVRSTSFGPDGQLRVIVADQATGERGVYDVDTSGTEAVLSPLWDSATAALSNLRISPDGAQATFIEHRYLQDLVELELSP